MAEKLGQKYNHKERKERRAEDRNRNEAPLPARSSQGEGEDMLGNFLGLVVVSPSPKRPALNLVGLFGQLFRLPSVHCETVR